jgi:hypothetical protein
MDCMFVYTEQYIFQCVLLQGVQLVWALNCLGIKLLRENTKYDHNTFILLQGDTNTKFLHQVMVEYSLLHNLPLFSEL